MKSRVIKYVAGGGKTTYSKEYFDSHEKGLYLAFTNSVVDELCYKGVLCKTIDSFISNYLVPKFVDRIPIIPFMADFKIVETEDLKDSLKGIGNISIQKNGDIFIHSKKLPVTLKTANAFLHSMRYFPCLSILKFIFGKEKVFLTQTLRTDIASFVIFNFREEIVKFIGERFKYVIIDEAQDIKSGHLEDFANLLYCSDLSVIFLGDPNQNINNGSAWFENLEPTENKNISYRCPEDNCKWIREHLKIDIHGNSNCGGVKYIDEKDIKSLDDGTRHLLYKSKTKAYENLIDNWTGPISTIQSSKGSTINDDIVIIGKSLNKKMIYTAITRTRKQAYYTIKTINE